MNVFLVNLLLLYLWNVLIKPKSCQRRKTQFIALVSAQLFIITFLSPITSDALMYADWARMDLYGDTNFGWKCLSKIVWLVWPNPKSLLVVVSVISLMAAAHFINRHSSDPFLSFLIYICMGIWGYSFFVFRQSIAISICMFAYDYLSIRDLRKFAILVLTAGLFHETALVFLMAIPFVIVKRSDKRKLAIELACVVAFTFFYEPILSFLLSIFRNGWLYEMSAEADGFGHLALLLAVCVACYVFDRNGRESVFQKNIELAGLIQLLSLHFPLLVRLVHYFDLSIMVAVPATIEAQESKTVRTIMYMATVCLFLCLYIFSLDYGFPGGAECYTPTFL